MNRQRHKKDRATFQEWTNVAAHVVATSAILLLVCSSAVSCSAAKPQITHVRFIDDGADEVLEIALNRPLDENERYDYQLELLTKNIPPRVLKCEGRLANDTVAMAVHHVPPAQTFRVALPSSCLGKVPGRAAPPSSQEKYDFDTETVRVHVSPGKVQSVLVVLGTYDTSFRLTEIGRWTFGPL